MHKNIMTSLLLLSFVCHGLQCQNNDLKQQYLQLSLQHPFGFFDIGLSDEQVDFLQKLNVNAMYQREEKPLVLNNFGDLDHFISQATVFFQSLGNSPQDSQQAAELVHEIVQNCLISLGQESAWIAIRAFKKNHAYDIARWHVDSELLYKPLQGYLYKIVYTLQGDSTLICNVPDKIRTQFIQIKKKSRVQRGDPLTLRRDLASLMQGYQVQVADQGQGAIFIMGDELVSAIHSEPVMDKDRIFMSIVPGSGEQIEYLHRNWRQVIENRFR